jgi:hypothetical protein
MDDYLLIFFIFLGLIALIFLIPQMSEKEMQKYLKNRKKRLASGNLSVGDKIRKVGDKIEKTTVTGLNLVFKAIFTLVGFLILAWVLSEVFGGLKALYYGSPFLFLFLLWFIFNNNQKH